MSGHSHALGSNARAGSIAPRLPNLFKGGRWCCHFAMQQATDIGNHVPSHNVHVSSRWERTPSQCQHSVLNDATVRSEKNLPAHFAGCDGRVPNVVALWEAFYIENNRFDLDTLRVPNRSPHPDFEI